MACRSGFDLLEHVLWPQGRQVPVPDSVTQPFPSIQSQSLAKNPEHFFPFLHESVCNFQLRCVYSRYELFDYRHVRNIRSAGKHDNKAKVLD